MSLWMGHDWSICQSLNTWGMLRMNQVQIVPNIVGKWGVRGKLRVNDWSLQLECARVMHEGLLISVLLYGNETTVWREERSRIRSVQMSSFQGLLYIRRMNKMLNARIREPCGVRKWIL